MQKKQFSALSLLWTCNFILVITYLIGSPGLSFLKSSILEYNNVPADPFDGAVSPIAYIPDWSKAENMNKSKTFDSFSVSDFLDIPEYNEDILSDSLQKTTNANILRYTYPVVYMGSYRGNHLEYDGSHAAVDIRAPIGTPVMSIANGVVVKIKNTDSGDGKYVIVRHDNVDINGEKETIYSGYLHLAEINAVEGTKIKRGEVLGKVGMTGITTTPHLHFQIDKSISPFHMYWPYSFREAADLGLDFFGAINVGLGKENAIRYTINPMDFIKNNRYLGSAPLEINIATEAKSKALITSSEIIANNIPPETSIETSVPEIKTIPEVILETPTIPLNIQEEIVVDKITPETLPVINEKQESQENKEFTYSTPKFTPDSTHIFSDIPVDSPFYNATKYLSEAGIARGYAEDGGFHPNDLISRSETILLYDRLFKNTAKISVINLPFNDVLKSGELAQALSSAYAKKIVIKNTYFRPNDSLTRAEAITLLMRTSEIPLDTSKISLFKDVATSNSHRIYINTFAKYLGIKGTNFEPNKSITRGELAKILYAFNEKNSR